MLLFVLGAIWGASYLFIRVAAPVLRPIPLVFIRLLLGGGTLFLFGMITHRTIPWRANWKKYTIIGLFNCAIPFTLISTAALSLTSSFSAMLNATTPLFTAVVAALWLKDALTAKKIIGLAFGLIGVGIIVGWQPTPLDSNALIAALLLLLAALSYGVATVYGRAQLRGSDSFGNAVGQLLLGGVWILPFAVMNPPQTAPTVDAIAAVLALALLSTSVAYLIYFQLLASAGATATASVTFLVPFFSSLWGAVILHEEIHVNELIGFGVILIGLVLVTDLIVGRRRVDMAVAR